MATTNGIEGVEAPTATKQDALTKLSALELKWRQASDEATRLGREHFEKRCRLHGHLDDRGLLDERRRLQHRDPEQFHPHGSPRGPEASRIQKEIEAIGDLSGLAAEVEHACRVEARRKQDVDAFVAEHIDAIVSGLRPEGAALAASTNGKLQEAVSELKAYIGFIGRASSLVAAGGREPRTVRGLDEAAELLRRLERVDLRSPLSEEV
ncbi:MAG TPA: hypothetical protein VFY54_17485 [Rubrobacter sp.]|nr:hypothetical protein [Rubrobacter sp.]